MNPRHFLSSPGYWSFWHRVQRFAGDHVATRTAEEDWTRRVHARSRPERRESGRRFESNLADALATHQRTGDQLGAMRTKGPIPHQWVQVQVTHTAVGPVVARLFLRTNPVARGGLMAGRPREKALHSVVRASRFAGLLERCIRRDNRVKARGLLSSRRNLHSEDRVVALSVDAGALATLRRPG